MVIRRTAWSYKSICQAKATYYCRWIEYEDTHSAYSASLGLQNIEFQTNSLQKIHARKYQKQTQFNDMNK